jgi:hypothetical protein
MRQSTKVLDSAAQDKGDKSIFGLNRPLLAEKS